MRRVKRTGVWAWKLAAVMAVLAIGVRTDRAEVAVTETPNRVLVENESVRLVFDIAVNYVRSELAYKRGSGRNLIVDNFCLYYQYIENGALRSVNEGYPGGQISNGRYTVEKKDGAVNDAGQTPNTQLTVLDYRPAPIIIENQNLPSKKGERTMDQLKGVREGFIFQYEGGYFAGFRRGGWIYDNSGKKIKQFKGDGGSDHHANFIEAVCTRKSELLNASIRQGHISSAVCHLGNLSFRLGADANRKEIVEKIGDCKLAGETFERIERHLAANEVDLKKTPMKMGPWLTVDRQTEAIIRCDGEDTASVVAKASTLARGSYRKPFAVDENI